MSEKSEKEARKFFYTFENLYLRMLLMEGPGLFCYSLPTLYRFSKSSLCPAAEKIINEHLSQCQWCRCVVLSLLAIEKAFFNAKLAGLEKDAVKFYNSEILTKLSDTQSEIAQKLLRAWNLI